MKHLLALLFISCYLLTNPNLGYGADITVSAKVEGGTTVTITGKSAPNTIVSVYLGPDNIFLGEFPTDSNGNFSITSSINISTSSEFLISPQGGYRLGSDVKSNIVVWHESAPGDHNFDIYGYDISTDTQFPVSTNTLMQWNPSTNGNIVVWQDERNGNRVNYDIYGYDIATQTEFSICTENSYLSRSFIYI